MLSSSSTRWALVALAVIAVLGALRFKPWQLLGGGTAKVREELRVGFLPVT
ncbi:MAG TPA: hypothetical protein VE262_20205 [Blastocatellia bacterium]|nr:hypothetical protein [Blastocatellia bacterium]